MAFPVDILATVDPESLEQSAKVYMSKLLYRNSEIHEYLSIPGSDKIEVGLCNVSFVPLYGVDVKQKVLALFSPDEPFKAVGLYLLDQWWSAEDILKTGDSSRTGLIKVKTPGERIVLYVLNRIIYRTKEIARDDVPFLCHGEDEIAKILWKNGEAIGFYSVKPEGTLCNDFLTQQYQLPVMDTIFIRKCHRGNGHGLQLLKDFVDSFREDFLGLKYPLLPAMYEVCKKYLSLYPEHSELLWEVDGVGSPFQRTLIARRLKAMDLKGNRQVMGKLNFGTQDSDIPMEVGVTQVRETMKYTEVMEEIVQLKITKEVKNAPVTSRGRSSSLKRKKLGAGTGETAEKIIRVEDVESDVQFAGDELACKDSTLALNLKEPELKDTIETMTCDVTPILEITHLHCEAQNKLTREPIYWSETEKEQVVDITPAQILQTFKATIAPVNLQPLECQQDVEVEIFKMSSETEAVKEKAVEIRVFKDGVNKEIPLDASEPSEEIVKTQNVQTDMAETANKEDTEDGEGMRKMSVIENIVEDTEDIGVENVEAGELKKKEQHEQVKECFSVQGETDDQEPSHDKEGNVNILIQQEENLNIAYGSGSKGKRGDERKSRRSRRLDDKAAKSELTERVLRSSSKKTFKATSKQVADETTEKGLNQTESQAALTEKEQLEEIAGNENVSGKIKSASIMYIASNDKEEIHIEKDYLDHQITDDPNLMEDSSKDEIKMEEKLREEQISAGAIEVAMTTEDGEEIGIVDVSSIDKSGIMLAATAPKPSAAEHIEEQKEEPALERVPAEDDDNIQVALKQKMTNIEASLDYEIDKTNKDDEKTAASGVHNADDVNAAGLGALVKVPEPSSAEPVKEQEEEPTSEMVPAEIANSTWKLQNFAVLGDSNKVSTMHTDASEDTRRTSQPESTDDVENKEADGLHQKVQPFEKEQDVEMTGKRNVTVEVKDKIQNSSIEDPEKMMETEEIVITTDADRVSELIADKNKLEDQEEKAVADTTVVQDKPEEEVKSKDIIKSGEDGGGVKSDNQIKLSEEEKDKANSVTPLQHSRRLKHPAAEWELTKRVLRSATKAVSQQEKIKQPVNDPEVEQMNEVVNVDEEHLLESQNLVEVENRTEDSSQDKNKTLNSKLRNEEDGTTKDDKPAVVVHDVEDVRVVEIEVEGSPEPSAAEPVACEGQREEPVSEPVAAENTEQDTSPQKLQNVAVVLVDYNKVPLTHISEDSKMDKEPSQLQEKEVQEFHKPESTDHRNEGEEGENQTECEVEPSEIELDKLRDEKMDIEGIIMSEVEDKFPESDEKKMNEDQEQKLVQPPYTNQDIPGEEPIIQDDVESGKDDDGLKSDAPSEEEEDKTTFATPLRRSKRRKHQLAESNLPKRVLRSTAKATKQPVDDPDKTSVEEKIESVSDTTETGHFKAVFKEKIAEQSASETVKEHKEESATETGPAEEDNTEEAMSGLTLEKITVVLVDENPTPPIGAGEVAMEMSQSQKDIDLELHKPESIDRESETEHTENEQVEKMTENEMKETDETVESQEGAILSDPESAVTDKQNFKKDQNDTPTVQEIQAEEPRTLHVIESSEEDEGERPDVMIQLGEDKVDEASSLTPLRRSGRLRHQAAESELTERVLRRSARLTNKATSQQAHKQHIKAMMMKVSEQLESEVAVGDHMESETVLVFAKGDPGNLISAEQSFCKEESKKEKEAGEDDDHTNVKNVSMSHGNEVEENTSSEDITAKEKIAPQEIIQGEAEQIYTSGQKSAVDKELSEAVEEVEEEVIEKARKVVEETHETYSKCDSEEVSAVSKVARKDQQINKAGKVVEGKRMVEEAKDRKDQGHIEGHLQDENQEIKQIDEPNREQIRSTNTVQDNAQEETFEKRKHLEEGKDKHTINILITEAVLGESDEGVGVERRALRKRTIIAQATPLRKSKRLCKQDQVDIEGQRANAEETAPVEATVMNTADVRTPTEKENTDQEIETIVGEMCHKEENQENAEGEKTSGNTNNSQENTVTEDMSKQARLSGMLNVSEDIKLMAQEKAKGKEDRKNELVTEEVMELENNVGKADKMADEPREFTDTQEEAEQSETNAEGMTEASVTIDKYFTLELDGEINSDDAKCNQVVWETKASFQKKEKQTRDLEQESGVLTRLRARKSVTASSERRSARRSRRLQPDGPSETEDTSEQRR